MPAAQGPTTLCGGAAAVAGGEGASPPITLCPGIALLLVLPGTVLVPLLHCHFSKLTALSALCQRDSRLLLTAVRLSSNLSLATRFLNISQKWMQ